jgi:uncharacterized membrane protein YcaP (DUF421 family)
MIDWRELFVPTNPIPAVILRGTLTYIMLFLILRFLLKRQSGVIGILVLTIVFWNYAIDWLGFRFPALQRLTRPPPLLLIKDGKMLPRNMRREMITAEELNSQLRQQGVENCSEVKTAYIEGDGSISIIRRDNGETNQNPDQMKGIA